MPEKTTSFKNANIGLTSGWSQGELLWGSPLNDDLMMLDTLCQARVNKIITSKNQQPVSINKGDAYIYAIESLNINLIGPSVAKNDIVIFRSGSINDYIAVTPKHGWKVFNKDDSSTYVYTKDDNKNILIWEKESVIKKYNVIVLVSPFSKYTFPCLSGTSEPTAPLLLIRCNVPLLSTFPIYHIVWNILISPSGGTS